MGIAGGDWWRSCLSASSSTRSKMPRQGSKAIGEVVNGVIPGQRFLSGERHIGPTVHGSWCDKEAAILERRRLDRWHNKYDDCDWDKILKTETPRRPEEERLQRERFRRVKDVTRCRPLGSPRGSPRLAKPKINLLSDAHEKKMKKKENKTPRKNMPQI